MEEAIHTAVEDGHSENTWRLWQASTHAVILGTGQESAKEACLQAAADEGVPVLRRHSGGGAVLIGPGAINYSAFYAIEDLPGAETIQGAMSAVLRPVNALLKSWGLAVFEAGLSDLVIRGCDGTLRKIAGNSQARKKRSIVVHGTILADPDWERLGRLLRFPSRVPDYRSGRDHRSFLTSLRENEVPYDLPRFAEGLRTVFDGPGNFAAQPSPDEQSRAGNLLKEKYANPAWNFRR